MWPKRCNDLSQMLFVCLPLWPSTSGWSSSNQTSNRRPSLRQERSQHLRWSSLSALKPPKKFQNKACTQIEPMYQGSLYARFPSTKWSRMAQTRVRKAVDLHVCKNHWRHANILSFLSAAQCCSKSLMVASFFVSFRSIGCFTAIGPMWLVRISTYMNGWFCCGKYRSPMDCMVAISFSPKTNPSTTELLQQNNPRSDQPTQELVTNQTSIFGVRT